MVPNLPPLPAAAPALPGKGNDAASATGQSFADLLTLDPTPAPASDGSAAAQVPAATPDKPKDAASDKDDATTAQPPASPDAALLALVAPATPPQPPQLATSPEPAVIPPSAHAKSPPQPPPAADPAAPEDMAADSGLPAPAAGDARAGPKTTAKSDTRASAKSFADLVKTAPADARPAQPGARPVKTATDTAAEKAAPAKAADPAPVIAAPEPDKTPAFSLQPAANTAASTYGPSAAPDAPPATSLSQVAVSTLSDLGLQIGKRLKDGNTKFDIELHPADLGKVEVALTIARDGKVSAHLSFDSPITATAFHARESELRQQLAQAGLDVSGESLSFSSRDSGAGSGFGASPQQERPPPSRALRALADAGKAADDTDLDTLLSSLRRPASRLALDLLV